MPEPRNSARRLRRVRATHRLPSYFSTLHRSSRYLVAIVVAMLFTGCGSGFSEVGPPIKDLVPVEVGSQTALEKAPDPTAEPGTVSNSAVTGADGDGCRTVLDPELANQSELTDQNPIRLILDAVLIAQLDDERCGQRSTEAVYCRALWLLEVLDPVVLGLDPTVSDPDRLEAAMALDWALTTATDVPVRLDHELVDDPFEAGELDPSVRTAFAQLRPLTESLVVAMEGVNSNSVWTAEHEERLALLLEARAHPSILEPLSLLQDLCLLGG